MAAQELVNTIVTLKAELEAENFSGSTNDDNADPRMLEIGNSLTLLECFYWAEYKALLIEHFGYSPNDFTD